ncbi:MAG TPA: hypothetical protein VIX91_19940 [Candidatus Acidoferrum sp.]
MIVFGDEAGAAELCSEFNLIHEPNVERFESKMPFVKCMFAKAQQISRHPYLCYTNSDIILMKDFVVAFEKAAAWRQRFLMVARRWDVDITQPIDFASENWEGDLRRLALKSGEHQVPEYVDFFLFSKGLYEEIPPLVVGYAYWDHWMVWRALSKRTPVLDASPAILPVHQNHSYITTPERSKGSHTDRLSIRNRELSGNGKHLRSILDSTHGMNSIGRIRRTPFRRQLESEAFLKLRQSFADRTYWLRNLMGLRRQSSKKTCEDRPFSPH